MKKEEILENLTEWLDKYLKFNFKKSKVMVSSTGRKTLSRIIFDFGAQKYFPQYNSWYLKSDVVGIITNKKEGDIVLINLLTKNVSIKDIGEYVGYSRIVKPILSMLIYTNQLPDPMITLLKDYGRHDILEYGRNLKHMRLAKWDDFRKEVNPSTYFPPGRLI